MFWYRARRTSVLDTLAALRKRGIVELMPTTNVKDQAALDQWLVDYEAWRVEALNTLKANYPESVYSEFEVVGSVTAYDWQGAFNSAHNHKLSLLNLRLKALERILERAQRT